MKEWQKAAVYSYVAALALWLFICTPMTTNLMGFKVQQLLGIPRELGALLFGMVIVGPTASIVGLLVHFAKTLFRRLTQRVSQREISEGPPAKHAPN